jgi:hypothetical protein
LPRRRALQFPARSQTFVGPTRFCPSPAGNNARSRWEHKSDRGERKAFSSRLAQNSVVACAIPCAFAPKEGRAEKQRTLSGCLANAGAQETSVILYAYLAAGQKIRHCRNHFCAAARAGTNCQDQITERQPSARSHDLAKLAISFHRLTISALSRSNATSHCEYVFHRQR